MKETDLTVIHGESAVRICQSGTRDRRAMALRVQNFGATARLERSLRPRSAIADLRCVFSCVWSAG